MITKPPQTATDAPVIDEPLLTAAAVSEWLRIRPGTLARWVREASIPVVTIGARQLMRFERRDLEQWLEANRTSGAPVAGPSALWTAEEVAHRLQVSVRTVRAWVRGGLLPAYRLGSLIRISQAALETWLDDHRSGSPTGGTGA